MRRGLIVVVGLLVVVALLIPGEAAACQRCRRSGLICNGFDDCAYTVTCTPASFAQLSWVGCEYDDSGGCYTTGDFCRWAFWEDSATKQAHAEVRPWDGLFWPFLR